jgi:ATP-dependent RNA helicase RhlE
MTVRKMTGAVRDPTGDVSMSFATLELHPQLLRAVTALGFTAPTPVQTRAIPPARTGRDVLACAATGTGKTAAFLLPTMHRLLADRRGTTRVLVLAPTRELAAQTDEQRIALGRYTDLGGAAIFGGVAMGPQESALRRGVDILVATPGRLLDHLRQSYARLHGVDIVVLDEADRMLDMGFLPDVRRIVKALPGRRQTLLFSATLPPDVVALARDFLRDPARIDVERPPAPAAGVRHTAYPVAREEKIPLLLDLLRRPDVHNVLAFTRTKHRADRLATALTRGGVAADRIHGNRSQAQRTRALAAFKAGRLRVLVATDIAARGIDVTGLSHVVNFDMPDAPESYIHRVGRTARADAVGDAVTFVTPEEEAELRTIERAVCRPIERIDRRRLR